LPGVAIITEEGVGKAPIDPARWAREPYPDYTAEVNRSIAFSGAEQGFFTIGKARRLLNLLRRHGQNLAQTRLLDIGCGIGLIHPHLAPSIGDITGVDVSAEALEIARTANPTARYQAYDGQRLPFPDHAFDAATAICVMHHVPPPHWQAFVAETLRILRPGGLFAIFEHNPWNPLTRLAVSRCAFDFDAVLLSPLRLVRLLRQARFDQVGREFLFFSPFSAASIQAAEYRLRWCPIGAQYVAYGQKAQV